MIYTSLDSSVAIENVDTENQNTDFVEKNYTWFLWSVVGSTGG